MRVKQQVISKASKRYIIVNSNSYMSYFQKYQRVANSCLNSDSIDSHTNEHPYDPHSRSSTDSRQSYLKAFKKYYIEKLITQKASQNLQENQPQNKEKFCFHETPLKERKSAVNLPSQEPKRKRDPEYFKKSIVQETQKEQQGDYPKMNANKIVALVNQNDRQLEELLYSSISQLQREMMRPGDQGNLSCENSFLRGSIQRLKLVLKQKLEVALKRNKEELTVMFQEYSKMIRKLLEDKQKLTSQLERYREKASEWETSRRVLEEEYENKIRLIVQENNAQVASTKQQIEQFLDMIIQFEEQANLQKEELERLRERVIELQMENDKLQRKRQEESHSSSRSQEFSSESASSTFRRSTTADCEIERYAQKIESLLDMVDRLQQDNNELNQFLRLCKCSKIKKRKEESESSGQQSIGETKKDYEIKLLESEKQFIREEMVLREAMRRKDQCIERLNLVIEEMRRERYGSVDRLTEEAVARQTPK